MKALAPPQGALELAERECPVCLLAGCRAHALAPRPVCVCDRPLPLEDGTCLKCGRPASSFADVSRPSGGPGPMGLTMPRASARRPSEGER